MKVSLAASDKTHLAREVCDRKTYDKKEETGSQWDDITNNPATYSSLNDGKIKYYWGTFDL